MAFLARPRAHEMGHEHADFGRGEELARALAGPFRELAQQIFVRASEEVGLYVGEAEAVARVGEGFDDRGQLGGVDVALAVALRGEVHEVDDTRKRGVVPGDRTRRSGQMLPDVSGPRGTAPVVGRPVVGGAAADDAPARFRGQVEAQQGVVDVGDLGSDLPVAVFLGQPVDFVVEDVGQALEKKQRQQIVLELGGVLFAADGAGRVPQHLLHRLGGGDRGAAPRPAARHAGGGFGRVGSGFRGVDAGFGGERGDGCPGRPLRCGGAAFPAVDGCEGDAEPVRELLLRQVEIGADGLQGGRNVLDVCHVCAIAKVTEKSTCAHSGHVSISISRLIQSRRTLSPALSRRERGFCSLLGIR